MIDWWEGLSGKKCSWEMIELCVRRIISKCFKTNNLLIYYQRFYLKDLLHILIFLPKRMDFKSRIITIKLWSNIIAVNLYRFILKTCL